MEEKETTIYDDVMVPIFGDDVEELPCHIVIDKLRKRRLELVGERALLQQHLLIIDEEIIKAKRRGLNELHSK